MWLDVAALTGTCSNSVLILRRSHASTAEDLILSHHSQSSLLTLNIFQIVVDFFLLKVAFMSIVYCEDCGLVAFGEPIEAS